MNIKNNLANNATQTKKINTFEAQVIYLSMPSFPAPTDSSPSGLVKPSRTPVASDTPIC